MPRLLEHLDQLPPWACRILAREHRKPISTSELSRRSGIDKAWINRISRRSTWAGVKVATADAFMAACGIDPFRLRRHREYIKSLGRGKGHSMAHARGRYAEFVARILRDVKESRQHESKT